MGEGKTVDAWDQWTARLKESHGNGNGHGASLAIEAQRLLPTPATSNGKSERAMTASTDNGRRSGGGQSSPLGLDEVTSLLSGHRPEHLPGRADLPPASREIVEAITGTGSLWGPYAAAVQQWETTLGRAAPAPTETGPKGSPRLAAAFPEWMMGLPAGWVTDVPGITRNEALKALGNGVVPQQAAAALRVMLNAGRAAA
jgi:DNA (cytosine-5)-methyltransferase 1